MLFVCSRVFSRACMHAYLPLCMCVYACLPLLPFKLLKQLRDFNESISVHHTVRSDLGDSYLNVEQSVCNITGWTHTFLRPERKHCHLCLHGKWCIVIDFEKIRNFEIEIFLEHIGRETAQTIFLPFDYWRINGDK